jgi:hypothetical protein
VFLGCTHLHVDHVALAAAANAVIIIMLARVCAT